MKIKVLDEKHIIVNNGDRKRSSVIIVNEVGTVTRARKTEKHQTAMNFTKIEEKIFDRFRHSRADCILLSCYQKNAASN